MLYVPIFRLKTGTFRTMLQNLWIIKNRINELDLVYMKWGRFGWWSHSCMIIFLISCVLSDLDLVVNVFCVQNHRLQCFTLFSHIKAASWKHKFLFHEKTSQGIRSLCCIGSSCLHRFNSGAQQLDGGWNKRQLQAVWFALWHTLWVFLLMAEVCKPSLSCLWRYKQKADDLNV